MKSLKRDEAPGVKEKIVLLWKEESKHACKNDDWVVELNVLAKVMVKVKATQTFGIMTIDQLLESHMVEQNTHSGSSTLSTDEFPSGEAPQGGASN